MNHLYLRMSPLAAAGLMTLVLIGCGKTEEPPPVAVTGTTLGNDIDDTLTTTRVKSALMADPNIDGYDFKVETRKGDVMLSGFVKSQVQMDKALGIVTAVEGVRSVSNGMKIKN